MVGYWITPDTPWGVLCSLCGRPRLPRTRRHPWPSGSPKYWWFLVCVDCDLIGDRR